MSIYEDVELSKDIKLSVTGIYSDNVAVEVVGLGIYVEDGIVNIPVKLWEGIKLFKAPPEIKDFVKSLGVDPKDVMEVHIHCTWDEYPTVELRMEPSANEVLITITKEVQK